MKPQKQIEAKELEIRQNVLRFPERLPLLHDRVPDALSKLIINTGVKIIFIFFN